MWIIKKTTTQKTPYISLVNCKKIEHDGYIHLAFEALSGRVKLEEKSTFSKNWM